MVQIESGVPLIEGFGDEVVLYGFPLLLLILLILVIVCYKWMMTGQADPALEELRERMLQERRTNMPHHSTDRQCPICLYEVTLGVETNCGHLFCGGCIATYWRTQYPSMMTAMNCPYCRQNVSVLFPTFRDDEVTNPPVDEEVVSPTELTALINQYNRRFSGLPRPWLEHVWELPLLLRHLAGELFSPGGMAILFRLRVFCIVLSLLLYIVLPFDVIPESVFGLFGLLDDIFIFLLVAIYISIIYRRFLANRDPHAHAD